MSDVLLLVGAQIQAKRLEIVLLEAYGFAIAREPFQVAQTDPVRIALDSATATSSAIRTAIDAAVQCECVPSTPRRGRK